MLMRRRKVMKMARQNIWLFSLIQEKRESVVVGDKWDADAVSEGTGLRPVPGLFWT